MKKIFFTLLLVAACLSSSCDKVSNPFPPALEIDTTIYPGLWSDYVANEWPDFSALPNEDPDRNVLIEDFTGHTCAYCPNAAVIAHDIHLANPNRVFVAAIHASNDGTNTFQTTSTAYPIKFWNTTGVNIAFAFGLGATNPTGFTGNPAGMVNRINDAGLYFPGPIQWQTWADNAMATTLKVAVKAKVNYFESPKHGFYLHTEVEKLDASLGELGLIAYMIEDSVVGPQLVGSVYTTDYVHRDIMRGTIDGSTSGKTLTDDLMKNGKYYVDYSYIIPDQLAPQGTPSTHNAENMHVLIYVYDTATKEILQVIKKRLI